MWLLGNVSCCNISSVKLAVEGWERGWVWHRTLANVIMA
jgi:hypothetical protein